MNARVVKVEMYDNSMRYESESKCFVDYNHARKAMDKVGDALDTLLAFGLIKDYNVYVLTEEESKKILENA